MAGIINLNDTNPAPPTGTANVSWQAVAPTPLGTPRDVSAYVKVMVGDVGGTPAPGLAPAPVAGDAALGKFLKADGTWAVPAGSGSGTVTHTGGVLTADQPVFGAGTGDIKVGTKSGTTNAVATVSGSFTPGNAVVTDSSGNFVDGGVTPGGGSGSGTVTNTGTLTANEPVFGNGGVDVKAGSRSGNTTKLATVGSGSLTTGHLVIFDSDGNVIDGGAVPSGGGGGGLVLLEQHTASDSASLDFTAAITSAYDDYLIEVVGLKPGTADMMPLLRMSSDGGATYDDVASNYDTGCWVYGTSDGWAGLQANAANRPGIVVSSAYPQNSAKPVYATLRLMLPGSTSEFKLVFGQSVLFSPTYYGICVTGCWKSTAAVNAFRFLMSSGNIAAGTIRVYGFAK